MIMFAKGYPEKGQVKIGECIAFGISIDSRHNKAWELAEMLLFTDALAKHGLQKNVTSVFYDSGSATCQFTVAPHIEAFSLEDEQIKDIALQTLSQFEWHGGIEHGDTMRNRNFP